MTNREALTETLARLGQLDGVEAEVQAAFSIADELDAGNVTPEMCREYRFAVKRIREVLGGDGDVDEGIRELIAGLGGTDLQHTADAGKK